MKNREVMNAFTALPIVREVLAKGPTRSSILTRGNLQIDIRVIGPEEYGSALQYFTGSKEHNIALRTLVMRRGCCWSATATPIRRCRWSTCATPWPLHVRGGRPMHTVTLIPGEGIGPEVTGAARRVLDASGVQIDWEVIDAGIHVVDRYGTPLPDHVLDSLDRNKVGLKGPLTTPLGKDFSVPVCWTQGGKKSKAVRTYPSVNVALRKELDLYANLRPARIYPGVRTRFDRVDLAVVRENTEDLYIGVEHLVNPDAAEAVKIITRGASERVVRFAFDYAVSQGRRKVTAVHKANILKLTDGLFLETAQEVSRAYPRIQFEDRIVDAMCMQLVQTPEDYDVLVAPNLYGDILSDLCAGLVGGLGVAPGANVGTEAALFEPVHGTAPAIAGRNLADPTAALLSGVMMLRHLGEAEAADQVEQALVAVLQEGRWVTTDLGGSASTSQMADAIVDALWVGRREVRALPDRAESDR